jgi:hypothetical protein
VRYEEAQDHLRWTVRHVLAVTSPAHFLRVEIGSPGGSGMAGRVVGLTENGGATRPVDPGPWTELAPGTRRVELVREWVEPVAATTVRGWLRPIPFRRVAIRPPGHGGEMTVGVGIEGMSGLEASLGVMLPPAELERVVLPGRSFHFATRPGAATLEGDTDVWRPAERTSEALAVELVPRTTIMRNAGFLAIRAYLYRPNSGAVAALVGLAAFTLVLTRAGGGGAPAG